MSVRLFPEDIQFLQRILRAAGCYTGPRDGKWSAELDAAEAQFETLGKDIADRCGRFDSRSEGNIFTLQPRAQEQARELLTRLKAAGIDARVISGTRTYAEQDQLFRVGRFGDTRKQVTKARAGASNHNFGIAWDIGIFEAGKYITKEAPYKRAAEQCPAGVEWGGRWLKFPDPPHYQLDLGLPLEELRKRFEEGRPIFV